MNFLIFSIGSIIVILINIAIWRACSSSERRHDREDEDVQEERAENENPYTTQPISPYIPQPIPDRKKDVAHPSKGQLKRAKTVQLGARSKKSRHHHESRAKRSEERGMKALEETIKAQNGQLQELNEEVNALNKKLEHQQQPVERVIIREVTPKNDRDEERKAMAQRLAGRKILKTVVKKVNAEKRAEKRDEKRSKKRAKKR